MNFVLDKKPVYGILLVPLNIINTIKLTRDEYRKNRLFRDKISI